MGAMNRADASKAAATYAVAWIVSAVVGSALAGLGVVRWLLPAYLRLASGDPTAVVLRTAAPGAALLLAGLVVWKVASAVVLYRTLSAAFAAETSGRLDTEGMKSDILSVMDERLADMKQDTQRTRRVVERVGSREAAEEFELSGER